MKWSCRRNDRVLQARMALVNALPAYAIDLDTINAIRRETYIVDEHILCIIYLQYETARFFVPDYDSREKTIGEQRIIRISDRCISPR